jgi:hypothetical protein
MLHVQAMIVKMQFSRMVSPPRREGFGCQATSGSGAPSFEAENTVAAKNARNK